MQNHQITLVGGAILPIYYAIKKAAPDVVHLIVTAESKKSIGPLLKLIQPAIECQTHEVAATDPNDIKQKIMAICSHANNISFQITGGNKLMALVAADIAKSLDLDAIYYAGNNIWINLKDYSCQIAEITLDNNEIISLSDHTVKSCHNFNSIEDQDIMSARSVQQFRHENYKTYKKLMDAFTMNNTGHELKKKDGVNLGGFNLSIDAEEFLTLKKEDIQLLRIRSKLSEEILLRAGWWEILVANAIHQWDRQKEIWIGTKFQLKKDPLTDKNEVDVLVNLGQNLLFVECKSGRVDQTDIYKMLAIRNTYGGEKSKSLLVSYMPVKADIREKCRDNRIEVLSPFNNKEGIAILERLPKLMNELVMKNKL